MNHEGTFPATVGPLATRPLGRTGTVLTELGCGCSRIGNLHGAVSEADAQATIAAAMAAGVRYFDVAPLYANGLGELRLGHALRGVPRDSYVLSTKVGRVCEPLPPRRPADPGALPHSFRFDYSYDGTLRSIEQSLLRLGANRIDIALIHDIDPFTHGSEAEAERRRREAMDGAYPALCALRSQGVVNAVGIGANDWRVMEACAREADFDCFLLAIQYTLLRQECLESFLPLCQSRGIPVIAGAPFGSGLLARGSRGGGTCDYRPADAATLARVKAIEETCASHGTSLLAAALHFPLGHPAVTAVLPGPRHAAHVEACAAAMGERVPRAFWLDLRDRGLIRPDAPVPRERGRPSKDPFAAATLPSRTPEP